MIFFYALGGGLGHFLRARAALNTLFYGQQAVLLTSCKRAKEFPLLPGVELLEPPCSSSGAQFSQWLESKVREYEPSVLAVDTFPAGLFGEIPSIPIPSVKRRVLFVRLLNFPTYERVCGNDLPKFEQIYLCEPISEMHARKLKPMGAQIQELELIDPAYSKDLNCGLPQNPFWLVDHSGPKHEVQALLDFARNIKRFEQFEGDLYIHSTEDLCLGEKETRSTFLFTPLFYPFAAKIFTAAGFNAIRQAGQFPEKHLYLPFERRFDDQFIRAALHAEALQRSVTAPPLFKKAGDDSGLLSAR